MVWVYFFSSGIIYAEKDETVVFFFSEKREEGVAVSRRWQLESFFLLESATPQRSISDVLFGRMIDFN